jgi:hypothetical protein
MGALIGGRLRLRLGLVALIVASGLVSAPPIAAAEPVFGPATATSRFGVAIELEQPVTVPAGLDRAEALVRTVGDERTFLATIQTPAAGATTLRYRHETPFGSVYPNTRLELGFRLTFDDGSVIDGPTTTVRYEDDRFAWRTLDGPLVRVHWVRGDDAFGQRALDIGERAVEAATELLGVAETERIDFFVYGDRDAFYDVLGPAQRESVGGIALPEIRTLFANIPPSEVRDPWVGIVIPHELTHLVFATATRNPYHSPPHWLNEGLADYLAQGYTAGSRAIVAGAARSGELMPLRALIARFPTTAQRFSLAYDESVSAIDYLIRTHGQDALVRLIRSYADGVSDDAAFGAALGVDVAGFEAGWLADLGIEEPPAYGPLPAPPGPLPPGWAAAPIRTPAPGSSDLPIATFRTTNPGAGDDLSGPIAIGVVALLAILLVVGLLVVARGLNRGDALPAMTGAPYGPGGEDGEPADADEPEDPDERREPWAPDGPGDDQR